MLQAKTLPLLRLAERWQQSIINMSTKTLIFISLIILLFSGCKRCEKYDRNYIPVDLYDAVNFLDCRLDKITKENLRREDELEPAYKSYSYHFAQLIYRWEMGNVNNKLYKYFNNLAIEDPQEMLDIIRTSLIRELKGEEIRLANQIDSIGQSRQRYINYINEILRDDSPAILRTFMNIHIGDTIFITLGDNCREQHPSVHVIRKEDVEKNGFCEVGKCVGIVFSKSIKNNPGIKDCYPDRYSVYHQVTLKIISLQRINFFIYDRGRFIRFEHGFLMCEDKDKIFKKVKVGDKFNFLLEDSGIKIFE